jgi:hypothetical protein
MLNLVEHTLTTWIEWVRYHFTYPCAVCCYDGTHQTSMLSKPKITEFAHRSTKACVLTYKESVSSVCSHEVMATSHQYTSIC